jgi:hypothetical protein
MLLMSGRRHSDMRLGPAILRKRYGASAVSESIMIFPSSRLCNREE